MKDILMNSNNANDFIAHTLVSVATQPSKATKSLVIAAIETPMGFMLSLSDDNKLYMLEFLERQNLQHRIETLRCKMDASLMSGTTQIHKSISKELKLYFAGKLTHFKTPMQALGTSFQKRVWEALKNIPFAQTYSYLAVAKVLEQPKAFRAVALANAANPLAIIVPCHRVINENGKLGGYAGGLTRKEMLLAHEKNPINFL